MLPKNKKVFHGFYLFLQSIYPKKKLDLELTLYLNHGSISNKSKKIMNSVISGSEKDI